MTNDEIIAMAKQAHHELVTKHYAGHRGQIDAWTMVLLEIFAKLVAEKEREACARICEVEHGFYGTAPAQDIRARGKE
jgi:hypothetical protein